MKTMISLRFAVLLLAAATLSAACATQPDGAEADPVASAGDQAGTPGGGATEPVAATLAGGVQVMEIEAGMFGYDPARIELQAGTPARLIFTRTVDSSCVEHVSIPEYGIEHTALPLNEPIAIEITPEADGEYAFVCGMDMQEGLLLVSP